MAENLKGFQQASKLEQNGAKDFIEKPIKNPPKKYLDLKGQMHRTPYGIAVTVYLNEKLLKAVLAQEAKKWEE